MFTQNMALEVAESVIRVNGIAPGTIGIDVNKDVLDDEARKKQEEQKIPLHSIVKPDEIARVPCFWAHLMQARSLEPQSMWMDGCL